MPPPRQRSRTGQPKVHFWVDGRRRSRFSGVMFEFCDFMWELGSRKDSGLRGKMGGFKFRFILRVRLVNDPFLENVETTFMKNKKKLLKYYFFS